MNLFLSKKLQTSKAFTLIELLVVISIISLLSSIVLASLNTARSKARDAKRIQEVKQIQLALELYRDDNGLYPISGWRHSINASWESWFMNELSPYLPESIVDPINKYVDPFSVNDRYDYAYSYYANSYGGAGKWYMLTFKLENQNLNLEGYSKSCDNRSWNYGPGNEGYIITVGGDCY